jgi:hypothetical protein
MNRAFYIIFIPVLLVALGYVLVFHYMGLAPVYPRLIVAVMLFFLAISWLGRRTRRKAGSGRQ